MVDKFIINGIEFCDFGPCNGTEGMHRITSYPMPEGFVQDVLDNKYPGIFLNPSCDLRNSTEFFGVFGTIEQWKKFRKVQNEAQIANRIIKALGGFNEFLKIAKYEEERYHAVCKEIESSYKEWWLE